MVKGSEGGLAGSNSVHLDEHGYGFARAFSSLCSTAIVNAHRTGSVSGIPHQLSFTQSNANKG